MTPDEPPRRTLAAEAMRRGTPALARSFRFHRPRGPLCGEGWCGQCKVEGGRLACLTPAGRLRRRRDPLRPLGFAAERLPPWFYEHGALRRAPALHLLRRLSAAGRLAASESAGPRRWVEEELEVAVVGEQGNVGGLALGVYEERTLLVLRAEALVAVRFERLVLATGAYDRLPPIPGNDLPGVIGLGALEAYAAQGGLPAGARVAVWGPAERRRRVTALGLDVAWEGERPPSRLRGRARLLAVDGVPCNLFVAAVAQPALELAAQAGVQLTLSEDGLPILVPAALPDWLELRGTAAASSSGVPDVASDDAAFACLCEDVRVRDVRRAIASGFDHPELVKRRTGAMTGPCQGKLCAATVLALLREAGRPHAPTTVRPPARIVTLAELASDA